jgi:hypothetical protein
MDDSEILSWKNLEVLRTVWKYMPYAGRHSSRLPTEVILYYLAMKFV